MANMDVKPGIMWKESSESRCTIKCSTNTCFRSLSPMPWAGRNCIPAVTVRPEPRCNFSCYHQVSCWSKGSSWNSSACSSSIDPYASPRLCSPILAEPSSTTVYERTRLPQSCPVSTIYATTPPRNAPRRTSAINMRMPFPVAISVLACTRTLALSFPSSAPEQSLERVAKPSMVVVNELKSHNSKSGAHPGTWSVRIFPLYISRKAYGELKSVAFQPSMNSCI